jgi:PAS domain S-box-containing protein
LFKQGFAEARLVSEKKAAAIKLERHVAQPTAELAATNDQLPKIASRRSAEEDLRSSEENYRLLVETASDAIVSINEKGSIVFANPAIATVFGYDPTELMGKPLTHLMPEYMRELHEGGFGRYLATGQRHINWQGTELTALRKNGEEFLLRFPSAS